jgi:hypothetical protein
MRDFSKYEGVGITDIEIQVEGEYPDFCETHATHAIYEGRELNGFELDDLSESRWFMQNGWEMIINKLNK